MGFRAYFGRHQNCAWANTVVCFGRFINSEDSFYTFTIVNAKAFELLLNIIVFYFLNLIPL